MLFIRNRPFPKRITGIIHHIYISFKWTHAVSSRCRSTLDNTDRSHRWGYMCHCWCNCSARHSSSQSVHWDRLLKGHVLYVVSQISSINDLHGLWHLDILIRHQRSVLFLFVNSVSFESVRVIRLHLGSILSLLEFNPEAFCDTTGTTGRRTTYPRCTVHLWSQENNHTVRWHGDTVHCCGHTADRSDCSGDQSNQESRLQESGRKKKFTIRNRSTHVTE